MIYVLSLILLQFTSKYEIQKVQIPSLFLSGLADQLIPPAMMKELYQVLELEWEHEITISLYNLSLHPGPFWTCRLLYIYDLFWVYLIKLDFNCIHVCMLFYFIFLFIQACNAELKHLETFNGGTHNDTWTRYGYYDHINKFISYVSAAARRPAGLFLIIAHHLTLHDVYCCSYCGYSFRIQACPGLTAAMPVHHGRMGMRERRNVLFCIHKL